MMEGFDGDTKEEARKAKDDDYMKDLRKVDKNFLQK